VKNGLRVLAFNCSLKPSTDREKSSTDRMLQECLEHFSENGATGEIVRVADYNILPGVRSESEGKGDAWPALRKKVIECDILVLGTPIWLGQPSSLAKRVMERMDAFLEEKDERGRMPSYGKIATLAVVGNEDGAHFVTACVYQALNDLGFTIPANGMTYWVDKVMSNKQYRDLSHTPKVVDEATRMMAKTAVHLAGLLKKHPYA